MKKLVKAIYIMAFMVLMMGYFLFGAVDVNATTNKDVALDYCANYCINYDVKIVSYNHVPKNRTDKPYVYVEKIKTKSIGNKWGKTKDGYLVKYYKSIKKDKTETVYLVYNPKTNACDDIICFVSNKRAKADTTLIYRNVKCCNCDGTSEDCVYYIHNLGRHMTENEIAEFEESEKEGW